MYVVTVRGRVFKVAHRTVGHDVILTAISDGLRDLLASRGERTDRLVRSLGPVSVSPRPPLLGPFPPN